MTFRDRFYSFCKLWFTKFQPNKALYCTFLFLNFQLCSPDPWRRKWQPTWVLLPGKSHGRRSLVSCSPWVTKSQTRLSDFTSPEVLPTGAYMKALCFNGECTNVLICCHYRTRKEFYSFLVAQLVKNSPAMQETPGFDPWVGKIPWRRELLPTPIFWSGEFYE